ncbi:HipA domain-containing protein [Limisalsivibrio acetivorans]|uniref:HipA domain-containing protein n=1 Tax=Limisalsivibrio acetivorans TaxID=1304888 RepID=UPI0003B75CFB|nr:HipA domain-containing protein [Limisalsivibrio acetivorans]
MIGRLLLKLNGKDIGYLSHSAQEQSFELSLDDESIKLSPHVFSGAGSLSIQRFLMNLLPEGQGLEELSNLMHVSKSNIFGLIRAIGIETTGALTFHPETEHSESTSFREINIAELKERIAIRKEKSITIWDNKPRLSVAGVQEKLPIMINSDGKYGLGEGDLASTHILKFGQNPNEHMVLNEHICMTLASKLKLPAAQTELLRLGEPVLSVKRFDRNPADKRIDRLHVIDGCQMLDIPPHYKYERAYGDGRDVKDYRVGATLPKLFSSAEACSVPAAATRDILNWVLFNLIIGNCDAHGKNISWHYSKEGVHVAPFYDMLCVSIYGDKYNRNLAIAIGNTFNEKVYAYDLAEMCDSCGLQNRFVSRALMKLARETVLQLESLTNEMCLKSDEQDFAAELVSVIKSNAEWYIETAGELAAIR